MLESQVKIFHPLQFERFVHPLVHVMDSSDRMRQLHLTGLAWSGLLMIN